jgi:hypothetical protein
MRVSVLLPTTGSLNRVLRIEPTHDLPASQVKNTLGWMPLGISKGYHALTMTGGLLWELGAPFRYGVYRLQLLSDVESGNSWELPVILAHLVVELGEHLNETPAKDENLTGVRRDVDIVLWATGQVAGKVNGKHGIGDVDYKLAAKVLHSRDGLQDAVTAGARIVALVPACEDAAPLRALLNEIGAADAVVETVASVEDACVIVKRELGHTHLEVVTSAPALVNSASVTPGSANPLVTSIVVPEPVHTGDWTAAKAAGPRNWKRRALVASMTVASVTSLMFATFIVGSDVVPRLMGPDHTSRNSPLNSSGLTVDSRKEEAQSPQPPEAAPATATGEKPATGSPEPGKTPVSQPPAENTIPPQPAPLPPAPLPVPVKLQEFRAANDGTCIPFIIERRTPPRTIDVALDSSDRFHESAGRNLCMLEWTVNPEAAGVQGFDVDPPRVPGVRLSGTGSAGTWTKVRIEFTRDFTNIPTTYTVRLKFSGAPSPNQVQQFQHTIR